MNELLNTFQGIRVMESPVLDEFHPWQTLSEDVMVTSKCRQEINMWLKDLFGTERAFYMLNGRIITHPNNIAVLKMMEKQDAT